MAEAARKRITIDEFLAFDGEGDTRYELVAGEIFAMAPASDAHAIIAANVAANLGQRLKPPCKVMNEPGIRLSWRNDTYYQADVAVTCSKVTSGQWGGANPVVIVEVLSPTTATFDRGVKLVDYRRIASVQHIVFMASDAIKIEHWQRTGLTWIVADLSSGDHLRLESIGFDIPVDALYDGLDFSADAAAEG